MATKSENNSAMMAELQKKFDEIVTANPNENKKIGLLSFSSGNIYIGLKAVQNFNPAIGKYRDPELRITASFNGHFVDMPIDGRFWKPFSEFATSMADALEGVSITVTNVNDDVDSAKKLISAFKGA